jgi:hypothetical protein
MQRTEELRLRHWKRVEQLGFWRYTALCTLGYGLTVAVMLAIALWQRVPHPDWTRFTSRILPVLLLGGFLFGVAEYWVKMWLYERRKRTSQDSATPNI